ncbi:hypothetical protein VMCG_01773 [Cytospora schulzeri]|uniref:RING-type domain-containing protein n=1 Tax=Cytospora schulzeri TaxID=448051 RepID=A0A423X2X4_9PEZI|nr:hypothetical protein VMCG_01773 [Valsa malicola]
MSYKGYDELIEFIDCQQDDVQSYARAVLHFIQIYQTDYTTFQDALEMPNAFVEGVMDEIGGGTSASELAADFRRQFHTMTIQEDLPDLNVIIAEVRETGTWERPGLEGDRPASITCRSLSSASSDSLLTPAGSESSTPQSPQHTPHVEEPGNYWPNIQLWLDSSPPESRTDARPTITCTICGDELVVEEGGLQPANGERERLFKLQCGHVFGVACLKGWDEAGACESDDDEEEQSGTKCPTCRQPILMDELLALEEAAIASLE